MLAAFRDEMADQELPYLWSDAAIYRYIDDAQKMFCRFTEGIEDARTYSLSVVPGTIWYTLPTPILKVREATRVDTGREVPLVAVEKARVEGVIFDGATGPLKFLVSGFEKDALRAWPVPDEAVSVTLSVFRLPLVRIEEADQDLEVDDQHEAGLMLWVRFRQYCAAARVEQNRRRHPAGAVIYGGI